MQRTLRFLREDAPGPLWRARAEALLPGYLSWFAREGLFARPGYLQCEGALSEHMPELVPVWRDLCEALGGGDLVARLLSLWCPPPFLAGCSQLAWPLGDGALVRNYDYAPWLWEGDLWNVSWCGRQVQGMGDCLWGMLDGLNESGLALSLAFGGSREVAVGFGMPLILRYVLETCATAREAAAALERVPSHMAYNVTAMDSAGDALTVEVRPGGGGRTSDERLAVNHQRDSEWQEYARRTASAAREQCLLRLLAGPPLSALELAARFMQPPLWAGGFTTGYGTLYTAVHEPSARRTTLLWHDGSEVLDLRDFHAGERTVTLIPRTAPRAGIGP